MIDPDMTDRIRGAFCGLAVGDALGAAVEFMTAAEIAERHGILKEICGGGWLRLKPGQVTDDTEMSLCIARAIAAEGGWTLKGIADNFGAWLKGKPVDVGSTCRKGIRNYLLSGALEVPFNEWDAGNGALMRMAPVALLTLGSASLLERLALEQARLTHHHPLSDSSCIALGRMTQLAIEGKSKLRLRQEADALAAAHPQFRFDPYRGLATGYVADTVQTVLHYFFKGRDFETCVAGTVNQGGDADTTGAICGMLAGAYYGYANIPRRWLRRMDRKVMDEIVYLADLVASLSPLAQGTPSRSPSR